MFTVKYLETGLQFMSHKYGQWIDWVRPVLILVYAPFFIYAVGANIYLIVKFPNFEPNGETNPNVCYQLYMQFLEEQDQYRATDYAPLDRIG